MNKIDQITINYGKAQIASSVFQRYKIAVMDSESIFESRKIFQR